MTTPRIFIWLSSKILLMIFYSLISFQAEAQSGGPPMITDDPDVVDFRKWEINTSINTSVSNRLQLAVPYLDVNYGIIRNLQLKIESPFLITAYQHHLFSKVIEIELGLKTQILNKSKDFISAGIYPQWVVRGEKGFLLPLLLEKLSVIS